MADTVTANKLTLLSYMTGTNTTIATSESGTNALGVAVDLLGINQLEIGMSYTQSGLTALNMIVEVSWDKTNWFQKTLLNIGGGSASGSNWVIPVYSALYQWTASTPQQGSIIDLPMAHRWMRLNIWGTGSAGASDTFTVNLGGGSI